MTDETGMPFRVLKDRMAIFRKLVAAEDLAIADRLELAKRYVGLETGLTRDEVVAILEEGLERDWPLELGTAGRPKGEFPCRYCGRRKFHHPGCSRPRPGSKMEQA